MELQDLVEKYEEVIEFRSTLSPETDRGCALMAAAYLDAQLEELLTLHFVDDRSVAEELLGQSKPLGSFSSRIDMVYALGFIGSQARRDLHLIRKIRNLFGHTHKPLSFEDPQIKSRCRELHYVLLDDERSRTLFTRAALGVLAIIHAEISQVQRTPVRKDKLVTNDLRENMHELAAELKKIIFEDGKSDV